jgi:hypothetical protein
MICHLCGFLDNSMKMKILVFPTLHLPVLCPFLHGQGLLQACPLPGPLLLRLPSDRPAVTSSISHSSQEALKITGFTEYLWEPDHLAKGYTCTTLSHSHNKFMTDTIHKTLALLIRKLRPGHHTARNSAIQRYRWWPESMLLDTLV